jgi:hypothetical protein
MDPTNTTNHATERALQRVTDAGLSGRKVLDAAASVAAAVNGSAAVLMTTLPEPKGTFWTESNGNQLWAVIRDHRVVTLMLRRDNQPATADRLRVDRVYRLQTA